MSPQDCLHELKRFVELILDRRLAQTVATPSLTRKRDLIEIAPPRGDWSYEMLRGFDSGTIEEYLYLLDARDYLIVLQDGSLVQMSFSFRRGQLTGHRLAYFPCPIRLELEDLENESLFSLSELVRLHAELSIADRFRLRAPFRFDFNAEENAEGHSPCHLHVNHESSRWPVCAPLSPGHFVRFLFRRFYPQIWSDVPELREWPVRDLRRTIQPHDELEPFIEWRKGQAVRDAA